MGIPKTVLSTRMTGSTRETEGRIRALYQRHRRPAAALMVLALLAAALCGGLVSCQTAPARVVLAMDTQRYDAWGNCIEIPLLTVEAVKSGVVHLPKRTLRLCPCLQTELLHYARDTGVPAGPVFVTRRGKPLNRTTVTANIQQLARQAQVAPEKCNPRCLRKLFFSTQEDFQRDVARLVERAHHQLLEQEQLAVGWEEAFSEER